MPLTADQQSFFRSNGYLALPPLIEPDELAQLLAMFDRDRKVFDYNWRPFGHHQTINCDALVTSPSVDRIIRHPRILPPIQELLGGEICFSEICLRHMGPFDGKLSQSWHRDRPHSTDHPLRMDYIQLMLYLTDVDESTHCFSISPESADDPVLRPEEQLARGGKRDLHGKGGAAILFNASVLHTATVRPTQAERKTIQIYYGRCDKPFLSNDSLMPATLWRDHPDAGVRRFYGHLNDKTRAYMGAFSQAT